MLSEAFLGAGVGRPETGLLSSWGFPGSGGLVGTCGRASGTALRPAATLELGPPSSPSLASSASCCGFGCEGGPGLAPACPPGPSLVHRSAHTKVPASGPLL